MLDLVSKRKLLNRDLTTPEHGLDAYGARDIFFLRLKKMLKNPLGFLEKLKQSTTATEKSESSPKKETTPTVTSTKPAAKAVMPSVQVTKASRVIDGKVQVWTAPEDKAKSLATKYRDAFAGNPVAEFTMDSGSLENVDIVIEKAYKQVFGNAHLMDSERSREAESQMRSGDISVNEFIRKLAKSDRYRALFFDKYTNVAAIELNFKHLLGRAPESYAEISQHIQLLADGGFEAEIDSYLDSDEYFQNFGDMLVPYPRGYNTQVGRNSALGFTRTFPMLGMACSSDKSDIANVLPQLQASLQDTPGNIPTLRSIPDSYPAELGQGPSTPRIPLEIKAMARQLTLKIESRRGFKPKF